MNLAAICHIPKSNYAYAYAKDELHIRLRTAKNDIDHVRLFYGIKYDWTNKVCFDMEKILSDEFYDYYEYTIKSKDTRIGYYFELTKGKTILCYTEAGYVEKFNDEKSYCYFFQYPYINEIDVHKKPSWVNKTNFYQIFVERFYNGNPDNSPSKLVPWDSYPTPTCFMGGDLEGIIKKMDYLSDLGINGVYLTPIFQSVSNHKYDTNDYMSIDKYFGDKDTLRRLVDECHKRKIRIVLDAVFNHCGKDFPPFLDVIEKGRASKYYDWFYIDGDKVEFDPINFQAFGFVPYMPKMNTGNKEVRKYLLDVTRYWTEEFNIDGWRLDVSDELDHDFWREFRKLVKSINSDAVIIGENWHDAYPWLQGDQFDSVMNYSLTKLSVDYFATNEIDTKAFTYGISNLLTRYSSQVNEMMLNLLDSHDTERFLTTCNGDTAKLKNAAAFLYGYVGMPCTYYGTEIGMDGLYDPVCRKGFDWNRSHWNMDLYNYYKELINIRNTHTALQKGEVRFIYDSEIFIMIRSYNEDCMYIVINNSKEEKYIEADRIGGMKYSLLEKKNIETENGQIKLSPQKAYYFVLED